jgi:integrase
LWHGEGHVEKNPVAHRERPRCSTRDRILDDSDRKLIFSSVRDQTFRDLLLALQEPGARPAEPAKLTAANINLDAGIIIWFAHRAKKETQELRVVYLTPLLREIVGRRLGLRTRRGLGRRQLPDGVLPARLFPGVLVVDAQVPGGLGRRRRLLGLGPGHDERPVRYAVQGKLMVKRHHFGGKFRVHDHHGGRPGARAAGQHHAQGAEQQRGRNSHGQLR